MNVVGGVWTQGYPDCDITFTPNVHASQMHVIPVPWLARGMACMSLSRVTQASQPTSHPMLSIELSIRGALTGRGAGDAVVIFIMKEVKEALQMLDREKAVKKCAVHVKTASTMPSPLLQLSALPHRLTASTSSITAHHSHMHTRPRIRTIKCFNRALASRADCILYVQQEKINSTITVYCIWYCSSACAHCQCAR